MKQTQTQKQDRNANAIIESLRKEHEKEILIQGGFMGFLAGSFFTGLMIHFLQKL